MCDFAALPLSKDTGYWESQSRRTAMITGTMGSFSHLPNAEPVIKN
jgi:hypothetical protein